MPSTGRARAIKMSPADTRAASAAMRRRPAFRFSLLTLLLVTVLIGGLMGLWTHRASWILEHELTGIARDSRLACFSADGKRLLTEGPDHRHLTVWDVRSGEPLNRIEAIFIQLTTRASVIKVNSNLAQQVYDALWDEDGRDWIDSDRRCGMHLMLIERQADGTVDLWNTGDYAWGPWMCVRCSESVNGLSPNRMDYVCSSGDGPEAMIMSAPTRYPTPTDLKGKTAVLWSGSFTPDGRQVIAGCKDGTIAVWDAASGEMLDLLQVHDGPVSDLTLLPDGNRVLTASCDGTARVWDIEAGTEQLVLRGHRGEVWSAQYRTDERRIVTAGNDGTVRVWDAVTGEPIRVFVTGKLPVRRALFSPDRTRVVAICDDRRVRVWRQLRPEGWEGLMQTHESRVVCAAALLLALIGLRNLYRRLAFGLDRKTRGEAIA